MAHDRTADPGCQGRILGRVDEMGMDETRTAIAIAHRAQMGVWKRHGHRERSKLLTAWHSLIQRHSTDLATLISAESGKPLQEAQKEVLYGAAFVQWFAEEAPRINGDIIPSPGPQNSRILVFREPVGPCALITPWNFPLAMLTRKAGAALAAGCTIVCKPAPETPLTTLALSVLAEEAGIPKGVFNVITSSKERAPEIGRELCTNPMIKKVSFTGSVWHCCSDQMLYPDLIYNKNRLQLESSYLNNALQQLNASHLNSVEMHPLLFLKTRTSIKP